ncbi:unnamed protein product [Closterium sp. Yama58-4]|nr:unnamed protein product [Closterium sp. Yama58-4]
MVHLTELRIVLPFTLDEFKRGQRYANWRTNEDATEPGQGGTLLSSTPYYHEQHGEGLFTHSLFRLGNRLPDWVNRLVPPSALVVDEKSWINYPYFRTIITIPFFSKVRVGINLPSPLTLMSIIATRTQLTIPPPIPLSPATHGDRDHSPAGRRLSPQRPGALLFPLLSPFSTPTLPPSFSPPQLRMEIETIHLQDDGSHPNALGLSAAELALRRVDWMDIGSEPVAKRDYKAELDPLLVKSKLTGRGPLTPGWQKRERPLMCAYKVVRALAEYWGVQNSAEKLLINSLRQIFLLAHKNCFGLLDQWYPLSLEQIIAITDKNKPQVPVPKPLPPPEPAAEPVPRPAAEPGARSKREGMIAGSVEEGRRDGLLTRGSESERGEGEETEDESEEEESEEEEEWDDEVVFYEAQMQWAAEEELYGEKILSDLGHPLFLCLEQPPPLCPLCCARTQKQGGGERSAEAGRAALLPRQESAPAVFCVSCGEFFCPRCFHEFHITPRLQQHATHPVAPSQKFPSAATAADAQNGYSSPLNQSPPPSQPSISARHSDSSLTHVDFSVPPQQEQQNHHRPHHRYEQQPSSLPATTTRSFSWKGPRAFSRSASSPAISHTAAAPPTPTAATTNPPWSSAASLPASYARAAAAVAGVAPLLPENDALVGDSAPVDAAVTVTNRENLTVMKEGDVTVADVQVVLDYLASEAGTAHRHKLQRFRILSELLADVQPQQLGHSERLAFWINVYNALAMHAYLVYGQPRSHYKRVMFMHKSAYIIAGLPFSILAIEHCILRAASFQPALAGLLPVQRYRRGDVRYSLALDRPEPLVTFALSCGCASAPPVRVYHPDIIHEQLKAGAQEYIRANVKLHPGSGKILLPKLLHWYSKDFARNAVGLLQWAAEQMEDGQKQNILQAMGAAGASKKVRLGRVPVQVLAYDWTFQYLLA